MAKRLNDSTITQTMKEIEGTYTKRPIHFSDYCRGGRRRKKKKRLIENGGLDRGDGVRKLRK